MVLFGFCLSILMDSLGRYVAKRWLLYLMLAIIGTEIGLLVNGAGKQAKNPDAVGSAKAPPTPAKEVSAGGK
jgi:hypothetical protein